MKKRIYWYCNKIYQSTNVTLHGRLCGSHRRCKSERQLSLVFVAPLRLNRACVCVVVQCLCAVLLQTLLKAESNADSALTATSLSEILWKHKPVVIITLISIWLQKCDLALFWLKALCWRVRGTKVSCCLSLSRTHTQRSLLKDSPLWKILKVQTFSFENDWKISSSVWFNFINFFISNHRPKLIDI